MHQGFDRHAILLTHYRSAIAQWDWATIKLDVEQNAAELLADPEEVDHAMKYNCGGIHPMTFLGTVFALMPSGKYYLPWCSNQTRSDEERDSAYMAALEEVAEEYGLYITEGEGDPCDLFAGTCVSLPLPVPTAQTPDSDAVIIW